MVQKNNDKLTLGSQDGTSATNYAYASSGPKICFPLIPGYPGIGNNCSCNSLTMKSNFLSSSNKTTLWIVLGSVSGFVVLVMILWFLFRRSF